MEEIFTHFKIYHKSTVFTIVCYWQRDRHTSQLKRIESRNKPIQIWTTNFDKGSSEEKG